MRIGFSIKGVHRNTIQSTMKINVSTRIKLIKHVNCDNTMCYLNLY